MEVVVETPRGCRNKFTYDERSGTISLKSVLPAGSAFPYDFGFVPGTRAADGDPLDVLILMDEPAFPGCRVQVRVIGVIEAEQEEDGKTVRNDRVIAVALDAHDYGDVKSVKDINHNLLKELEQFFVAYNETRGKTFRLLATRGPKKAIKLVQQLSTKRPKRKAR